MTTNKKERVLKPVKVGILGLGTVGGGAAKVLQRNAAEIARRAGREILITRASAMRYVKNRHDHQRF
jgi:homoserine dehydrogenase